MKLIQATDDPVVVPDGVDDIVAGLGQATVELDMIDAARHGIINEDIGRTRASIVASLDAWARGGAQSLS